MRQRFTMAELMGILAAGNGTSSQALAVQVLIGNLQVATYIDLTLPNLQAGIWMLVAFGLITSDRATTILTTVPAPSEVYQE
jgi:hypothetical protein